MRISTRVALAVYAAIAAPPIALLMVGIAFAVTWLTLCHAARHWWTEMGMELASMRAHYRAGRARVLSSREPAE